MRVPLAPPDHAAGYLRLFRSAVDAGTFADFAALLQNAEPVDAQGRYLHWDEFCFKTTPGPNQSSAEDRWIFMRHARAARAATTPFADKTGEPFSFVKTDAIERALHRIDSRARGGVALEGPAPDAGAARKYLVTSLYEEPFSSSVFEGAVATRDQAKKIMREMRAPHTPGERMILNNYRAIEFIKSRAGDPLTPALVLELHRIITQDTLDNPRKAGVLRAAQDRIVVEDEKTLDVLHDPPPASALESRLALLCDFANAGGEEGPFIHPILRAIIIHFMLAYDHPFVDGNGRTARALFYWAVLKHGYWLLEYVSISKQIKEAPVRYGEAFLKTETDGADLTYFIINQIEMIEKSIAALYVFVETKQRELATLDTALNAPAARDRFNHRQVALLNRAARATDLAFTIAEHEKTSGVSYLTARADLEGLLAAGMFSKGKRGVRSVYRPARDLAAKLDAMQNPTR